MTDRLRVGIVTVSDSVSQGKSRDATGAGLIALLCSETWSESFCVVGGHEAHVVCDDEEAIGGLVEDMMADGSVDVVVTAGGTGPSPRDVTPEALAPLLGKRFPGIVALMHMISAEKSPSPFWSLSRPVAALAARYPVLVIALPGSPKGAIECLEPVLPSLVISDPCFAAGPSRRGSKYPMIPLAEATKAVLDAVAGLPSPDTITVALEAAVGRVLAEDVVAHADFPPFPASMKDGYAVVAADGAGTYPVVDDVVAGANEAPPSLQPGSVVRITTGAPLPPGADAVVMVERTEVADAGSGDGPELAVTILDSVQAGADVRPPGCDIAAGTTVLAAGTVLTPADIGLLATLGVVAPRVVRAPRVVLLSTGTELVEAGTEGELPRGRIRDSNRPMLAARLAALPVEVVDLGIVADDEAAVAAALAHAAAHGDLVLTSGGVSMGQKDLVKPLLATMGSIHFGRVCLKPGKPTTFATLARTPASADAAPPAPGDAVLAFALPGNPVSALVTFELFVAPALALLALPLATRTAAIAAAGVRDPSAPALMPGLALAGAVLGHAIACDPARPEFHRVVLQWSARESAFVANSTGVQRSSRLASASGASALAFIPQQSEPLAKGAAVDVVLL
ncbi:gephyrin [Thecamonas trahens ATCC 50062]|uniref:Gephyrin n=1 Tax=Thecamonas trahens ATCC 50062 TaxID=461836 RepID=A0A0L0DM14_THETB|nr:gephyrin [Thecamonas trahens ATCC 50062]KNC53357.1 gephyrin [Thecamonas trahens ATCC 50062]|eukprot:XP_013754403.1 gephyrin [Thecamonas trahens ATCC 50062]